MLDEPPVPNRHEQVAVAAVVVQTELGEDREVAGHPRVLARHLEEANVREDMTHDPLHLRSAFGTLARRSPRLVTARFRSAAEELDDRFAATERLAPAELELTVLAERGSLSLTHPRSTYTGAGGLELGRTTPQQPRRVGVRRAGQSL